MPAYEFRCNFCGDIKTYVFRKVENRDELETCENCKEPMERIFSMPANQKPFTPYYHRQLDKKFYSRSEEKQYAKKHGLVNISGDFGKSTSGYSTDKRGKIK